MRKVWVTGGLVLGLSAALAWAQQRGAEVVVGGNWVVAPSSASAEGSVAWFFDAAQNRVLACHSSARAPAPVCHAGEFPARK